MWLTIILLGGLACTLISMLHFDLVNSFADSWIILVSFLVGMFIGLLIIIIFILVGLLFIKKDEYQKGSKYHTRMVCRATEFLLHVFRIKVMTRGMNQIPLDEKFLFITNHQSMFDSIACVWTLRGFPLSIVLKQSLMKIPVVGKYLHANSFIPINRENPREGVKAINKAADRISSNSSSVVICPEGTRSNSYEMGDFHNGSFKIALKAKCPIVLCSIQNACQVKKRFPFKSTTLYIDVIEVLKYDDFKDKSTQEISDYAYEIIKNNLNELPKY